MVAYFQTHQPTEWLWNPSMQAERDAYASIYGKEALDNALATGTCAENTLQPMWVARNPVLWVNYWDSDKPEPIERQIALAQTFEQRLTKLEAEVAQLKLK